MENLMEAGNPYHEVLLLAIVAGLASHQGFRKYEPTISGFLGVFFSLQAIIFLGIVIRHGSTLEYLVSGAMLTTMFGVIYLGVLGLSIVLYRVYLHPLRHYPGPKLSRITKIEWFFRARDGHFYLHVNKLHKKYGDVVRVGPNDIAFCDPSDTPLINGPLSKMAKGAHADGSPWAKARSVTFVKERAEHRARRRIWDQGFTTAALQQYEPRIASLLERMSDQFASRIGRGCGLGKIIVEPHANFRVEEINFADWTSFFAFDAMGDLGFGNDFGMVEKAMKMRIVWMTLPWCKYIVNYLPIDDEMKEQTKQFVKFGNERFDARKAKGTTRADIFSHLLAHDQESGGRILEVELREDAKAIIIAGSDTTSFALVAILYCLIQHEQAYEKLEKEIDALNAKGLIRGTTLGPEQAPYINGVINEALRLFPPAPEPTQRTYGESPYILNGKLIPPHTNCYVSVYTLARDERNFSAADKFIPERWIETARPEMFNHNTKAFVPFGSGLFNCAGRTLAQLELRQFIATLLYRFHFSAGRSFNPQSFLTSLRSNGTMESGGLPLLLTARNAKCSH
ncbi:uncharacterized protein PAC_00168 [Phialocephala subalpina]|uniref:Pisatin demethylase cytochrome P450 n=1 Tax=Phialocephala subalpina TaxID=576137 RepID=A0A1L7WBY8_9HELO|nr:uncharacterized protein PAC_00168 [Phialocephala subalpina]